MTTRYLNCLFWTLFVLLNSCPVLGQDSKKKMLTPEDYHKWGTLQVNSVSDDGKWCSYTIGYEQQQDTLFVQSTDGKRTFVIPKGKNGTFVRADLMAYQSGSDLHLLRLDKGYEDTIRNVKRYNSLYIGKYLVTYHNDNSLQIRNGKGQIIQRFESVTDYNINTASDTFVYINKAGEDFEVGLFDLKTLKSTVLLKSKNDFTNFSWQFNGKSFVFCSGTILYNYSLSEKRLYKYDVKQSTADGSLTIAQGGFSAVTISDDGEKVFFSVSKPLPPIQKEAVNVEVWNGNDAKLFPVRQLLAQKSAPQLAVWFPHSDKFKVLSDELLHDVRLTSAGDYVLLSDTYRYGTIPKYPKEVDFYVKDVRTGAEKLLLEKQSYDNGQMSLSPFDNSILYFRGKHWWLYNPKDDSTTNITAKISSTWEKMIADDPAQSGAYGVGGWTSDGKSILLYDQFDLWEVALDGSFYKKLTNGRDRNLVYRINKLEFEHVKFRKYENGPRKILDLQQDIVLDVVNVLDWSGGFAVYSRSKGLRTMVHDHKYFSMLKRSKNNAYVYANETYSQPPQLGFMQNKKSSVLYQSNRQQSNYHFGRSELIHYKNSEGKLLKGALFYPADYNEGNYYPMVVNIYEHLSSRLHRYVSPSMYNEEGFNISNFTGSGYFVLLPDIFYDKGNPGISATDCVTAAVKEVLAKHKIATGKIGLIGHSFGGYETDFIITQSDMFGAAVSGAGISNTIGHYFNIEKNGGWANDGMWRFEEQQFRMRSPFYTNKKGYFENSPLHYADHIITPLLQWTGKSDPVVPFEQSMTYYMALRRLGLDNILLVYPEEGHSLSKASNQEDLTKRIVEWFDYYLKDKRDVGWITNGTKMD